MFCIILGRKCREVDTGELPIRRNFSGIGGLSLKFSKERLGAACQRYRRRSVVNSMITATGRPHLAAALFSGFAVTVAMKM